jgi:dienelactone hydrolase
MLKKMMLLVGLSTFAAGSAQAAIQTALVDYKVGGKTMEGYVAYDDTKRKPRPGILIVHDWMGLTQFDKDKANQLANEGYVAFAVDVYGKGIRPKNADEAKKLATKYKNNRKLLRERMGAAFDTLTGMKEVNQNKIIVMGYCFGGTAALELARSGAPLKGTAVFHGGLSTPTPKDAMNINGPVLVMHGADDPNVPPEEVKGFMDEMKMGHVTFQFVSYPGAVHAFTNPAAGNDNSKGAAYNEAADKASWIQFEKFLRQVF